MPFVTVDALSNNSHFYEEDKVLIAEIKQILTLTLTITLVQTKFNSKRRN